MSFLKYLQEDMTTFRNQPSQAFASGALQPDYNKPFPKPINPFAAVLVAHLNKPEDMKKVEELAEIIKKDYNNIDMNRLNELLKDYNLTLKSKHPNSLYYLFDNLGKIVKKFS